MTGLITLDELVENHPYLRDHWSSYKRMLKAAQLEPMKYGLDGSAMNEKLKKMEKLIAPIEMKVIEGNMFEVSVSRSVRLTLISYVMQLLSPQTYIKKLA